MRLAGPLGKLHPDAQHLSHAPRLRDAAARCKRQLGVEHFANRSNTRIVEMMDETCDGRLCAFVILRVDLQPSVHERSNQPRPHGALMISGIARAKIAEVPRFEIAIVGRQRSQTHGREQFLADDTNDRFPSLARKHRVRQRHGEYLSEVHGRLYPAIMRGVTTPEVADDEQLSQDDKRARAAIRNARANFARTGASTILGFIKAGGDVRGLDVQTVTKYQLQTFIHSKDGETPKMEMAMAALQRVEKQIVTWAQEDPEQARAAANDDRAYRSAARLATSAGVR